MSFLLPESSIVIELGSAFTATFQAPALQELAYSCNRLLRAKLPLPDPLGVHLRLLHRQLRSPQASKRSLESLAPAVIEKAAHTLWCSGLQTKPVARDALLSALIAVRQGTIFSPQALAEQSLAQLNMVQSHTVQSGQEPRPNAEDVMLKLVEALRRFACPNPWLSNLKSNAVEITAPKTDYWRAFHLDRALQNPLPWTALLNALSDTERQNFPELTILGDLVQYGEADPGKCLEALEHLLQQQDLHAFWQAGLGFWQAVATVNLKAALPQTLVLVEGSTEAILLPAIATACEQHWQQKGIWLHGVGGKNAMAGWVTNLARTVSLPLKIVLDRDAEPLVADLLHRLRSRDSLFLLPEGELEDILPLSWIVEAVNAQQQPFPLLTADTFLVHCSPYLEGTSISQFIPPSRCEQIRTLYRAQGWGGFDKVQLANRIAEQLHAPEPVALSTLPLTLQQLLKMIAGKPSVSDFYRIGLTGGIASGKSTVGKLLEKRGIPVLDTDQVVHTLLKEDRALRQQIASVFGSAVFNLHGELDREALGLQVFGDPAKKRLLEGWIHPKVRAEVLRFFEQTELAWQQDSGKLPLAVAMIPLLFESALGWMVDESWLVLTSEDQQLDRLVHTRGMSLPEAHARIRSQWPQSLKQNLATVCLQNYGKPSELMPRLDALLKKFMA